MEDRYLNAKIFLSQETILIPSTTDEFIKLYHRASPENVFRVEKLISPVFQDYTITFSAETDSLREYTCSYDREADRKVKGVFIFSMGDMHVAFPDRFFATIEDMIEGNKFKIDHGRVYYSFKEGEAPDIESFISFKKLGYDCIKDYETAVQEKTAEYYAVITQLVPSLPQNIIDRYFSSSNSGSSENIQKESCLFYYKQRTGNPSYEQIIEAFKHGYEDFETYMTSRRYGDLTSGQFSEFRKYIDTFNTYESFLKGKNNSIRTESGVMLFEKLAAIQEKCGYSNIIEALIDYILETYIFEKMSREAFVNKIRSLVYDILNKYGMQENGLLKDYDRLLDPAIRSLEAGKTLFEYNESTGIIRVIK